MSLRKLILKCLQRFQSKKQVVAQRQAVATNDTVSQLLLKFLYHDLYQQKRPALPWHQVGFRKYSQSEEDGLLLYIFSLIGETNKKCVEFAAGNGKQCNTANLILNHRWIGLLLDAKIRNIQVAKEYYRVHADTMYWPPKVVHEWLTAENINDVLTVEGFVGEVDLLSLDVDGNDFWLWKALSVCSPRVIVTEINHLWGPQKSVTVPYDPQFKAEFNQYGADYAGASLPAFVKLGNEKGYRLVGTNAIATNAFFIRNDIACDWLPEVKDENCVSHPHAQFGMTVRFQNIKDKPWVQV